MRVDFYKKSSFFTHWEDFEWSLALPLQSFVHLVFRDEKDPRTECEHWQYWHSQQPNPQQRAFDIGKFTESRGLTKSCGQTVLFTVIVCDLGSFGNVLK